MREPGALVIGEALVDEVTEGDRILRRPGGSPANVAIGLARLGVTTRLHTTIGYDADGELITGWLKESGVALTAGSMVEGPTSKAAAAISPDGSARYRFTVSWAPSRLDDLESPTLLHAGSLGAFLEPGAEVTRDAVQRARALGALVTFDPNIRASLLPDPHETRESSAELAFSSNVTKMSDEDADYLYPGVPLDTVLDRLIDGGVSVAAITCGAEGAYLASGTHRVRSPVVRTPVADTVGAGDSFMAALTWALVFRGEGWDGRPVSADRLAEVGSVAVRAAAMTVSRVGADLPTVGELETERDDS